MEAAAAAVLPLELTVGSVYQHALSLLGGSRLLHVARAREDVAQAVVPLVAGVLVD
jgi:hypothetical protein